MLKIEKQLTRILRANAPDFTRGVYLGTPNGDIHVTADTVRISRKYYKRHANDPVALFTDILRVCAQWDIQAEKKRKRLVAELTKNVRDSVHTLKSLLPEDELKSFLESLHED